MKQLEMNPWLEAKVKFPGGFEGQGIVRDLPTTALLWN